MKEFFILKVKVAIAFVLCSIAQVVVAQNNDSLYKAIDRFTTSDFDSCIWWANFLQSKTNITPEFKIYYQGLKGKAYYFKGNYDSAAIIYKSAVQAIEKANYRSVFVGNLYNDVAKLNRKIKNYPVALSWYDRAMTIFEVINDSSGMQMIWNERGVVFEFTEQFDSALFHYGKSLEIAEVRKDTIGMAYCYNFIGIINAMQNNKAQARESLLQSIDLFATQKDSFAMAQGFVDIAKMYLQSNDPSKALQPLVDAKSIADKLRYKDLQLGIKEQFIDYYKQIGNTKAALDMALDYSALKDSLYDIKKQEQLEELNTKYKIQLNENENNQLRIKVQRRNIFLLIGLSVLTGIGLYWFQKYKRNKVAFQLQLKSEILKQQDLATKAVIEAEEKERNRIAVDLHDGVGQLITAAKFNLSSIQEDVSQHIADKNQLIFSKSMELLDQSAKDLRSVAHSIVPNVLLKSGLGTAIKDFVERIDNNYLRVNLMSSGLNEKLDSTVEIMVYRIIQECVNNVIKHSGATNLDISIYNEKDALSISIEDNGKGFDKKVVKEGIGLSNIQTRVTYLKGILDFDSAVGKGTFISIHIPKGA